MYKGEIPFVRLLVPLILGIVLAWYYPFNHANLLLLIISGILIAAFWGALLHYQKRRLYLFNHYIGLIAHLMIALFAYQITCRHLPGSEPSYFANFRSKSLLISINSEPTLRNDILRFEARVHFADRVTVKGNLLIALKVVTNRASQIKYGDMMLVPAAYQEVEPPYNPDEFDFKYYLKTRKILHQSFINEHETLKIDSGYGNQIMAFALNLRRKIVDQFRTHINGQEAASLASTLIMGYRADLSPEILNAYAKTGTMHVLSVSGMHVALFFLLFSFLLKPLDQHKNLRIAKLFLLIFLVWFYALLTGFSPSVNRAALMLSFVIIGKAVNKSMNAYNLLAVSAFILLLINPLYLFDIGFQLSYLAVFGLVFIHPIIYEKMYFSNKILDAAWAYLALSLAAQIITAPLSMYVFHQFPLYFLFSNLLIVIPVTLIMYVGVVFVLLLPLGILLNPMGLILYHLIAFTNQALQWIESMPFASLQGIWFDQWQLILLYLIIFSGLMAFLNKNKFLLFTALICSVLFLLSLNLVAYRTNATQKLIFYSLRKNSAIAFINGKKIHLVTELNPEDKAYLFSVKPSLEHLGSRYMTWHDPGASYYSAAFCQQKGLMQFGNFKVMRWGAKMNGQSLNKMIKTDILLLSGNPDIKLKDLERSVSFKRLLIDGTNPDYKIKKWMLEARSLGLPYHVLKKNSAWIQDISPNIP
jgi:competence protein ComEC